MPGSDDNVLLKAKIFQLVDNKVELLGEWSFTQIPTKGDFIKIYFPMEMENWVTHEVLRVTYTPVSTDAGHSMAQKFTPRSTYVHILVKESYYSSDEN